MTEKVVNRIGVGAGDNALQQESLARGDLP
jgi:hypothetical protein